MEKNMAGSNSDTLRLLKRVVELAMPNLRRYYRVVRKARIVASYDSDGKYWADVQPLRNDETADPDEPVVSKVEIPIMWAGPNRGVVCPPMKDALCDLEYYDGDPNFPRISNFRWQENGAPACEVGAFIIQHSDGTYIKIDADKNLIEVTPANSVAEIGGDKTETIGGIWTIKAPLIRREGNVESYGTNGEMGLVTCKAHTTQEGSMTMVGHIQCLTLDVAEDASVGGNLDTAGNSHANGRTGAGI
jgi:hypothetical protein